MLEHWSTHPTLHIQVRSYRSRYSLLQYTQTGLSLKRHTRAPRPPSFPKRPCLMFLRPPKNILRHPTAFYLVLKIRFKLLPTSGCFGLEVTSWTCGTWIPSSNPAVCSSCVTFSPLFFLFLTLCTCYVLTQMTRKKVAVGHKDGTACLSSPPPPLHDISGYNPAQICLYLS